MRGTGLRNLSFPCLDIDGHHCPLCLYQEFNEIPCQHIETEKPSPPAPFSSTAIARTAPSGYSRYFSNHISTKTTDNDTNNVVWQPLQYRRHPLRRKPSPTTVTLRELSVKHSEQSLLRSIQSDEQLQQVYESQIMAYLGSPLSDLGLFT